jgi:fermentation-respiration switch protein FrsA (DUF1100 family)
MDDGSPTLAELGVLARQHVAVTDDLDHHELYTWDGLLTLLWHRPVAHCDTAVLYCGGAMGGVLGPAGGLFHTLGTALARDGVAHGIRVGYRAPNDLERCVYDTLCAAGLAAEAGVRRFVVVGHSFGGAVAVQAAVGLRTACAGVVTLASQSAGCEPGEALAERSVPVLLLHGDRDAILPPYSSQMVQLLTGGELVVLPGSDHLLTAAAPELPGRVGDWITARLTAG